MIDVQPHDLDAEQSVLGAILLDPTSMARITFLRPDDFYSDVSGEIFRAARNLFARGEQIDSITLAHELETMGLLERAGGRAKLALLQEETPTALNILSYAEIVREKSVKRRVIQAGQAITKFGYDHALGASETIGRSQQQVFTLADYNVTSSPESMLDLVSSYVNKMQELQGSGIIGLRTGYPDLDRILRGLKAGDLIIVAGRPSMGKSAIGVDVALNVAKQGNAVAMFSLEMSKEQLTQRILSAEAQIDKPRLDENRLSDREWEQVLQAAGPLGELPLHIDEQSNLDDLTLLAKARQLAMQVPLKLIVVDYLQLINSSRDFNGNMNNEVGHITKALKALAKELRVPVIVACQLSREPDKRPPDERRPRLSDLRDSGNIEQDADIVLGMYRASYYERQANPPTQDVCEVLVLKHRNGMTGTVKLAFFRNQTRFASYAGQYDDDDE